MHESLNEFEFQPDQPADLGLLKNQCLNFFSVTIDSILSKLADNEEMHNILDEIEFRPDWTTE